MPKRLHLPGYAQPTVGALPCMCAD